MILAIISTDEKKLSIIIFTSPWRKLKLPSWYLQPYICKNLRRFAYMSGQKPSFCEFLAYLWIHELKYTYRCPRWRRDPRTFVRKLDCRYKRKDVSQYQKNRQQSVVVRKKVFTTGIGVRSAALRSPASQECCAPFPSVPGVLRSVPQRPRGAALRSPASPANMYLAERRNNAKRTLVYNAYILWGTT